MTNLIDIAAAHVTQHSSTKNGKTSWRVEQNITNNFLFEFPKDISEELKDSVIKRLKSQQFKNSEYWPGWKYLDSLALPPIKLTSNETVTALNDDNQVTEHPLAKRIASTVCKLFDDFHEDLEELNRNPPY